MSRIFFTRGIKNAPGYEYGAFQARKEPFCAFQALESTRPKGATARAWKARRQ